MTLTHEEIREQGLDALRRRSGRAGMVRFLQQFSDGKGDYATRGWTASRWPICQSCRAASTPSGGAKPDAARQLRSIRRREAASVPCGRSSGLGIPRVAAMNWVIYLFGSGVALDRHNAARLRVDNSTVPLLA